MDGTMYGIVAGYDGSPGAAQALRWAAREARARDAALTVCRGLLTRGLPYAESVLGPGRVRADLTGGPAARVLCERSRDADAQLLVVGARGRGGFDEMSLGSVAHAVLQYAPVPVAVVRPR